MAETCPYVEGKLLSGAAGSVDTAVMLRDGILEQLENRAPFAARDAIGRAMENFPQYLGRGIILSKQNRSHGLRRGSPSLQATLWPSYRTETNVSSKPETNCSMP